MYTEIGVKNIGIKIYSEPTDVILRVAEALWERLVRKSAGFLNDFVYPDYVLNSEQENNAPF